MNFKYLYLKNSAFLLIATILFSTMLSAQKKPKNVSLDVDADDVQFCSAQTAFQNSRTENAPQRRATVDNRLIVLNERLADLKIRINDLKIEENALLEQKKQDKKQLDDLKKPIDELKKQEKILREQVTELQRSAKPDSDRIALLSNELSSVQQQQNDLQRQQNDLQQRQNDTARKLEELRIQLKEWERNQDDLFRQQQQLQPPPTASTFIKKGNDDDGDGDDRNTRSQLCILYNSYLENIRDGNALEAVYDRNDMIDLVVGQIDLYFKHRKDGRRTKIRIYETILDFLRIGGDLSVAIMNGERVKSIIGASLGALDTGRTKFDKIFEILESQVLVNNMIAKRATLLTGISKAKNKPVRAQRVEDAYSWNEARIDLRKYLLAGTFDDALDSLVKKSGKEAEDAEALLAEVTKKPATKRDVIEAGCANDTLETLDSGLRAGGTKADEATEKLKNIVGELLKDADIAKSLNDEKITAASTGRELWNALFKVRGDFVVAGKPALSFKMDRAIAENCKL